MQKAKQITGVLLTPNLTDRSLKASTVTYKDDIHEMYKLIGCECFDCVVLRLGDQFVDAYVDDVGLMKEPPVAVTYIGGRQLAGNILLIGHDDEGNSKSLTTDQLEAIEAVLENGITGFVLE